ncbi:MAG: hypothetical protein N3G79_07110 [Sulfolobales archaeon]|nr:hypothetical protein [Sulfolobales archaeon]
MSEEKKKEEEKREAAERFRLTPLDAEMAIKRVEEKVNELLTLAVQIEDAVEKMKKRASKEKKKKDVTAELLGFAIAVYLLHELTKPKIHVIKRKEEED